MLSRLGSKCHRLLFTIQSRYGRSFEKYFSRYEMKVNGIGDILSIAYSVGRLECKIDAWPIAVARTIQCLSTARSNTHRITRSRMDTQVKA